MRIREHEGVIGKRDAYPFNPRFLKTIPHFNVRDLDSPDERAELDELKLSIKNIGVQVPLHVRMVGDDIFILSGHRRHRAVMELIAEGCEIESVLILHENQGFNDADRDASLITSNSGKPLTPLQKAEVVRRLLAHGWDHGKIGERTGMARNTIAGLITLLETPAAVQQMVKAGEVSASLAIKETKANGPEAAAETFRTAHATAKASGQRKVTPRQIASTRHAPAGKSVPRPVPPHIQDAFNAIRAVARELVLHDLNARADDDRIEIPVGALKAIMRVYHQANGGDEA